MRISSNEAFDFLNKSYGYGNYSFSGKVSDRLIETLGRFPSEEEVIDIVDDYGHNYGGSCVFVGKNFRGKVYTD